MSNLLSLEILHNRISTTLFLNRTLLVKLTEEDHRPALEKGSTGPQALERVEGGFCR